MYLKQWSKARTALQEALDSIEAVDHLKKDIKEALVSQMNTSLKEISSHEESSIDDKNFKAGVNILTKNGAKNSIPEK